MRLSNRPPSNTLFYVYQDLQKALALIFLLNQIPVRHCLLKSTNKTTNILASYDSQISLFYKKYII